MKREKMYLVVNNAAADDKRVGLFDKLKVARNDHSVSCLCCATVEMDLGTAKALFGRQRFERGIHTVWFRVEPRNRRLP